MRSFSTRGIEAFSGLLEVCAEVSRNDAHFTAIGAVNGATLGWFDPQRKMSQKIPSNGQHEVIGMSGDVRALSRQACSPYAYDRRGGRRNNTRSAHVLRICVPDLWK